MATGAHEPAEADAKRKDWWDKFDIGSKVAIAALGIIITLMLQRGQQRLQEQQSLYQQHHDTEQDTAQARERRLAEIQTIERLMAHLVSHDTMERQLAFYALQEHTNASLVAKCVLLLHPQDQRQVLPQLNVGTLHALKHLDDKPLSTAVDSALDRRFTQAASATAETARPASPVHDGWAYLGDYRETRWQTHYFDFPDSQPVALIRPGTKLTVRDRTGSLSVRRGMPTDAGEFPEVKDVLREGRQVTVQEVRPWLDTGYMWAHVTY